MNRLISICMLIFISSNVCLRLFCWRYLLIILDIVHVLLWYTAGCTFAEEIKNALTDYYIRVSWDNYSPPVHSFADRLGTIWNISCNNRHSDHSGCEQGPCEYAESIWAQFVCYFDFGLSNVAGINGSFKEFKT